ncbi:methyltransferase domain-containing protein [Acidihalobacter yilgarnensis]|uniref:methyltransferase domain-containing protein n=1 Tax=Acidihalobacter yilgarnensis TaxID=2819280 RepID=UPI000B02FA34|nr:methyltransferase domain-containing protein [Acidihalobacter yilgarnensis]
MTRANEDRLQAFYSAFEERFRGSFETIRQRLEYYLPVVRQIHEALQAPALDLGAGRGEWVALLQEAGIPVTGIDSNRVVVERARAMGLPMEEGDLMTRLREVTPGSLGVISAFHVIEHLPWEVQLDFFRLVARALKPDGLLILEWPNIEVPEVAMRSFWLDPTHIRPVPVELVSFMAEFEGFRISHIERLNGGFDIALLAQRQVDITSVENNIPKMAAIVGNTVETAVPSVPYSSPRVPSVDDAAEHVTQSPVKGLNIIGHVSGNLGLGVFARQVVEALVSLGVPVAILDIDPGQGRGRHDLRFAHLHVTDIQSLPHEINLFLLPPATMPWLLTSIGESLQLLDRINVLWAMWELPVVPAVWHPALRVMDVVLGGSRFVEAAMAFSCDGPLALDAPVPVSLPEPNGKQRADFGLPEAEDAVMFVTAFEPASDHQRKNPFAAIKAFLAGAGDLDQAHLLIKINNAGPGEWAQQLAGLLEGHPRVHLMTESLSYTDTVSLYACCDAFISLHRAEGLGLVPMEFMALGKPVVATAWSGNMSYMTPDSACLVSYRLIPVDGDTQVYSADFIGQPANWADPDVDEAAVWVRALAGDAELRRRIGERARGRMREYQAHAGACRWLSGLAALRSQYDLLPTRRRRKVEALAAMANPPPGPSTSPPPLPVEIDWRIWAEEAIATGALPTFGLVVLASEAYDALLPRTLAALDAQWLLPASVSLVGEGNAPAQAREYPWCAVETAVLDAVNQSLLALEADWVCLIHAGDQLSPEALFRLATAMVAHPEWQVIYTDEYQVDLSGEPIGDPHFKPDFNLDYLRSMPYTGGVMWVRRDFFARLGGFDPTFEGLEEYELMLRAWEQGGMPPSGMCPARCTGGGSSRVMRTYRCRRCWNRAAKH